MQNPNQDYGGHLAKLLDQENYLTPTQKDAIESFAPRSISVWIELYLNQPDCPFDADSLANWCANQWHIERLSEKEFELAQQKEAAWEIPESLTKAPETLVPLASASQKIKKLGILDVGPPQNLSRMAFLLAEPIEWRLLSLNQYRVLVKRPTDESLIPDSDKNFLSSHNHQSKQQEKANELIAEENNHTIKVEDAPMVRFIYDTLRRMVNEGASDVHFEPFSDIFRIRARIDGILHDISHQSIEIKDSLAVRIKVMAQLDIAEKRLPQDGSMKLTYEQGKKIDCRISTMPTIYGEKIVVRFLNNQATLIGIGQLGMESEQQKLLQNQLDRPHGLVLMTGPTGSGKTVSLYACLNELNTSKINISTVEDPVEIFMPGVNQVNINEKAGVQFASVLRSLLRQDPDVIMVGEIRDLETADISLKAAQTGHLVFSTLHTNDAPLALTRLVQMGVAPYNVAASVSMIVAQRLLRQLCSCKVPIKINPNILLSTGLSPEQSKQTDWQAFGPYGCEKCHNTGYRGRTGVFEVLAVGPSIQNLVLDQASSNRIRDQALQNGMISLRQAGLRKMMAGGCTLEEVIASTM